MKISSRLQSYLIITLCYITTALVGMWVFQALNTALWLSLLIADLAATFVIWMLGQLLNNASVYPEYWYLVVGALANTALFLFISIPLAEKHLATYKAGYTAYLQETRPLLPLPKWHIGE